MAKVNLPTVTDSQNVSTINANFQKIASELNDKALYRDNPVGEPNQVSNDVDMNGNDVLNAGSIQADSIRVAGKEVIESALQNAQVQQNKDGIADLSVDVAANATGITTNASDIANNTSDIAERVLYVDSLAELPSSGIANQQVSVKGYHTNSSVGGGVFVFGTGRHNGGTFIDPLRAGEIGTAAYYVDSGVDVAGWARIDGTYAKDIYCAGAVRDNTVDSTDAFIACREAFDHVIIPDGNFAITHFELDSDNQNLYKFGNGTLTTLGTSESSVLKLSGRYCKVYDLILSIDDVTKNSIEVTGFRCYLSKVISRGNNLNALFVNAAECHVLYGTYKGGVESGILVERPDLFLQGPYIEGNLKGLKTVGQGSINAYHTHAYANTEEGFFLSGAAYSQLTSCYADTNGTGFRISDTSSGFTLTDCWGFKSEGYDWIFLNAKNIKMQGCHSNGDAEVGTKTGAMLFSGSDSQIDLIGCHTDSYPIVGFESNTNTCVSCTGGLLDYNFGDSAYVTESQSTGSAATTSASKKVKLFEKSSSSGQYCFEIDIASRENSGSVYFERFLCSYRISNGSATITAITSTVSTLTNFAVSSVVDGIATVSFDLTSGAGSTLSWRANIKNLIGRN